jgi:hypothetical protein
MSFFTSQKKSITCLKYVPFTNESVKCLSESVCRENVAAPCGEAGAYPSEVPFRCSTLG